jgi:hypothetical protein
MYVCLYVCMYVCMYVCLVDGRCAAAKDLVDKLELVRHVCMVCMHAWICRYARCMYVPTSAAVSPSNCFTHDMYVCMYV